MMAACCGEGSMSNFTGTKNQHYYFNWCIRQIYTALVLFLTGNYETGAPEPWHDKVCKGSGQFAEKIC